MANEVIEGTEESNENEAPVIEATTEGTAAETAAEETPREGLAAEAKTEETPAATTTVEETPQEEAAVEAKVPETPTPTAAEETPQEEAAVEAKTPETQETSAPAAAEPDAEEQQNSGDVDFGAILEKFEADQTIYHSGELVTGKVVGISDRGVLVDFGYKSEGAVPREEFINAEGEVTVKEGDTVEVVIRNIHTGDGPPMLSRNDALRRKTWDEIENAYNNEEPVKGFVIDKTKGGLRVDINGIEAFLPGSQIDSRPFSNLDAYIGKEIEAKVIKFSRRRNNLVLSRKVLTDEVVNKQKAETLKNIEEGYVIEGVVKNLTQYGAFIDIGGLDGLLHVTDMFWDRQPVQHDPFKIGETVQVKVLKLDREREKVALGYKQLNPDPWQLVPEMYPVGSKVKGRVSSATDYGIFVELEPGIEGLVHISEMSWSKRQVLPRKLVRPDEEVEVQVLGIDTHDHRISLGMKQLQPNPWKTIGERYHVGDRIRGKVRNITDFGAFVEIEEGIDGLVHVSDITWSRKVRYPKDLLEKDQEVDAIITSIDPVGHRMSLSMKDITPSEWESFIATHKTGDIVRGTVTRFAGFGVFAKLGNELEGLCHISELADERVEKPEDVVSIGQEMDFKILRIDHEDRKIGLSARAAAGSMDRDSGDSRSYSTEAKGGMASLGELMNLKRGKSAGEEEAKEEPKLSKKERKALKAQEKAAAAEASEGEAAPEGAETVEAEATTAETAETPDAETATSETAETPDAEIATAETPDAETATAETAETPDTGTEVEAAAEEKEEPKSEDETATEAAKTPEAEASVEAVEEEKAETRSEDESAETVEAASEAAVEEAPEADAAKAETETAETGEAESADTPQLTDIEGEATAAPEETTPRDETAEEEAKGETESMDEISETPEETEEKTAGS